MLSDNFPSQFWSSLNLRMFAENSRQNRSPNLWCLCSEHLSPNLIARSDQQVSFSVSFENQILYLSAIYASTSYLHRRRLWQ